MELWYFLFYFYLHSAPLVPEMLTTLDVNSNISLENYYDVLLTFGTAGAKKLNQFSSLPRKIL